MKRTDRFKHGWVQRLVDFLEYDEVSLFVLNYSFLLLVLTDRELLSGALWLSANPLTFVYGLSTCIGLYLSVKHIWRKDSKSETEVFFMIGGGAWLALSVATITLMNSEDIWSRFMALYAILYNFLILWFMGAVSGFAIAYQFMAEREAQWPEALVSTVIITILALSLRFLADWKWWEALNACVFYSLGANKILMGLLHQRRGNSPSENTRSRTPIAELAEDIDSGESTTKGDG